MAYTNKGSSNWENISCVLLWPAHVSGGECWPYSESLGVQVVGYGLVSRADKLRTRTTLAARLENLHRPSRNQTIMMQNSTTQYTRKACWLTLDVSGYTRRTPYASQRPTDTWSTFSSGMTWLWPWYELKHTFNDFLMLQGSSRLLGISCGHDNQHIRIVFWITTGLCVDNSSGAIFNFVLCCLYRNISIYRSSGSTNTRAPGTRDLVHVSLNVICLQKIDSS